MEKVLNYFPASLCENGIALQHANFSIISYQFKSMCYGNKVFPSYHSSVTLLHLEILISTIQFGIGVQLSSYKQPLIMKDPYLEFEDWYCKHSCNIYFLVTEVIGSSATICALQLEKFNVTNELDVKYLKNKNIH